MQDEPGDNIETCCSPRHHIMIQPLHCLVKAQHPDGNRSAAILAASTPQESEHMPPGRRRYASPLFFTPPPGDYRYLLPVSVEGKLTLAADNLVCIRKEGGSIASLPLSL